MDTNEQRLNQEKVSLEGERYIVETEVQNRTATIQVDISTGEIKGFQIEEQEQASFPLSTRATLIIGGGIATTAIVIVLKVIRTF